MKRMTIYALASLAMAVAALIFQWDSIVLGLATRNSNVIANHWHAIANRCHHEWAIEAAFYLGKDGSVKKAYASSRPANVAEREDGMLTSGADININVYWNKDLTIDVKKLSIDNLIARMQRSTSQVVDLVSHDDNFEAVVIRITTVTTPAIVAKYLRDPDWYSRQ
jgi:hypothetical protein